MSCNKPAVHKPAPFFRGLLAHRREMRRSTAGATSIETSNNIFNEVLCQSMADLNMLMTETPQGRYPYAAKSRFFLFTRSVTYCSLFALFYSNQKERSVTVPPIITPHSSRL